MTKLAANLQQTRHLGHPNHGSDHSPSQPLSSNTRAAPQQRLHSVPRLTPQSPAPSRPCSTNKACTRSRKIPPLSQQHLHYEHSAVWQRRSLSTAETYMITGASVYRAVYKQFSIAIAQLLFLVNSRLFDAPHLLHPL
jgi:hypothetical protein